MQPVYLALPSSRGCSRTGPNALDPVIADFIDGIAMFPATAERLLFGVVEYSSFVNELCPLGSAAEYAARVTVSGFDGLDYAALLDGLGELLQYDRHRLAGAGRQVGRPVIAVVLEKAGSSDDWRSHRMAMTEPDDDPATAPVVVAVSTSTEAMPVAEALALPTRYCSLAPSPERAGGVAAALVVRALGTWGIGDGSESTRGSDERNQ